MPGAEVPEETRSALESLRARYFFAVDTKQWEDLRALFTDDATFAGVGSGVEGPAHFVERTAAMLEHVHSMHYGSQPLFRPDPVDPALVHGHWTMQDFLTWDPGVTSLPGVDPEAYALHGFGYYEERYRFTGERWLIAHMRLIRTRIDATTAGVTVRTFTPGELPRG